MSPIIDKKLKTEFIKQEAHKLGFECCGITLPEALPADENYLRSWLAQDFHGSMHYLAKNIEKRVHPAQLVEGTRSVIVVAQNYFPKQLQQTTQFRVAKYAYGEDYHVVVKDKLHLLLQRANEAFGGASGRCFTDSAPIFERSLAQRAGLGWIGNNGLLIIPRLGSYFFLGTLFIDHDLEVDTPFAASRCGTCRRCLEACPSGALLQPRCMDARRCISYQNIENRAAIDEAVSSTITNQVYGCDICQDVCPWNAKAKPHHETRFDPKADFLTLSDEDWQEMNKSQYDNLFSNSAISRAGWGGLKRNIDAISGK